MTDTRRRWLRALLLITGLLLGVRSVWLAYSYDEAAGFVALTAAVLVVASAGANWKVVAMLFGGAVASVATWATLGGGAEEWTAAPWAVIALVCFSGAGEISTRRRWTRRIDEPQGGTNTL